MVFFLLQLFRFVYSHSLCLHCFGAVSWVARRAADL